MERAHDNGPGPQQIIRTVIDKITVAVVGDSELVDVTITWAGGHDTVGQAFRPVARLDQLSYYPRILALVTELTAAGQSSAQIARALNDQGLRPPKRTDRFGSGQVLTLARRLGLRVRHPRGTRTALTGLGPDHWSIAEIAVMLEMPTATIYNWIYRGWITRGTRWRHPQLLDHRGRRGRIAAATRTPGPPARLLHRARWTQPGEDPRATTRRTGMKTEYGLESTEGGALLPPTFRGTGPRLRQPDVPRGRAKISSWIISPPLTCTRSRAGRHAPVPPAPARPGSSGQVGPVRQVLDPGRPRRTAAGSADGPRPRYRRATGRLREAPVDDHEHSRPRGRA